MTMCYLDWCESTNRNPKAESSKEAFSLYARGYEPAAPGENIVEDDEYSNGYGRGIIHGFIVGIVVINLIWIILSLI